MKRLTNVKPAIQIELVDELS